MPNKYVYYNRKCQSNGFKKIDIFLEINLPSLIILPVTHKYTLQFTSFMKESIALLISRIGFGGMMLTHGWPKLEKLISTGKFQFADPIGVGPEISLILAIFAEFVCSILIILGIKTKLAAIPPAITMLVAVLLVHGADPFRTKEFPLLYLFGFLVLVLLGGGEYSLDRFMGKRR